MPGQGLTVGRLVKPLAVMLMALLLSGCAYCDRCGRWRDDMMRASYFEDIFEPRRRIERERRRKAARAARARRARASRKRYASLAPRKPSGTSRRRTSRPKQSRRSSPKSSPYAPPPAAKPKRSAPETAPPRQQRTANAERKATTTDETKATEPKPLSRPVPQLRWTSRAPGAAQRTATGTLSCGADRACERRLRTLQADTSRIWIDSEPTAEDFVSGARLVAFVAAKAQLTCVQLATGLSEAETASGILQSAISDEQALNRPTTKLRAAKQRADRAAKTLQQENDERC